jgi:hypothetical protein
MQNYPLLEAVGESGLPVLLKRGPSATMDEFLLAAEYILKTGNTQVMLCERGIRTFEDHTRYTLPLATVPYLHEKTHLPVVVDPQPRHRQGEPGGGDGPCRRRGRRRRDHRRGSSEPGEGVERRFSGADAAAVQTNDG